MVRLLVLIFAALLVWTFAQIVRLTVGDRPAMIATLCLILSCNFVRLSVSAMIGIPCLTFALLAIYGFVIFDSRQNTLEPWKKSILPMVSGGFMALSLLTKMFTLFLIPLIAGFWIWSSLKINKKIASQSLILFSIGLIFGFIAISLSLGSSNYLGEFWQFHISNNLKSKFVNEVSWQDVALFYLQDFDYVIICLWGIFALKESRYSLPKFPLVWLGSITILLLNHKPLWYHHYLLVSIPICWLAALGFKVSNYSGVYEIMGVSG